MNVGSVHTQKYQRSLSKQKGFMKDKNNYNIHPPTEGKMEGWPITNIHTKKYNQCKRQWNDKKNSKIVKELNMCMR